jgi:hypothetical protein
MVCAPSCSSINSVSCTLWVSSSSLTGSQVITYASNDSSSLTGSQSAHFTPAAISTGYGPCPNTLNQDFITRNVPNAVSYPLFDGVLTQEHCARWCLCWGLISLARGVRRTQAWEKHTEPSPSLRAVVSSLGDLTVP